MAADTAAARREARRRRILENSENRLHKITGRHDSSTETTISNTQLCATDDCDHSSDCKVQKGLINGIVRPESVDKNPKDCFEGAGSKYADEILRRLQNNPFIKFEEPVVGDSDDETLITRNEREQGTSKKQFFFYDLHFIYLAVVIRTLFEFQLANIFCELMFLPFLLLLIPREILLLGEDNSNAQKLVAGVLMLMGLPHSLVTLLIKLIMFTSDVIGALAMYLVAFTVTDCAIAFVKS